MLGAVMVLLQAQAGLGIYLDTLDLETRAFIDAVIPAPGTMNLPVQRVLFSPTALQFGDNGFHLLAARTVCHQYGIRGFNDDQIVDSHQADQTAGSLHQRVAAVRH